MKIVLYSRSFPPATGGMERFAEQLSGWLAKRGHDVIVVAASADDSGSDRRRPYPVVRCASPAQTRALMRQADVVNVNGLSARGLIISAEAAAMKSTVVTHLSHQAICPTGMAWAEKEVCDAGPHLGPCLACDRRTARASVELRLHRWLGDATAMQVSVSEYLRTRLGVGGKVVYNPVAQALFQCDAGSSGEPGLLVAAGRFVREKGFDLLLRGVALVDDAALELVGDGPLRGRLEVLAKDLEIADRVRFLGERSLEEVADAYRRAALVVVPSRWSEPFGYAVAEAMALGRPVLATDRGAFPELLRDGRGSVASPDDVGQFSKAMNEALESEPRRRSMGIAARAFAERELHVESIGRKYENIYRSCMR